MYDIIEKKNENRDENIEWTKTLKRIKRIKPNLLMIRKK